MGHFLVGFRNRFHYKCNKRRSVAAPQAIASASGLPARVRLSHRQPSRLPQPVCDMRSLLRNQNRSRVACALICLLALADASWVKASRDDKTLPTPQGLRIAPAAFVLDGSEGMQR